MNTGPIGPSDLAARQAAAERAREAAREAARRAAAEAAQRQAGRQAARPQAPGTSRLELSEVASDVHPATAQRLASEAEAEDRSSFGWGGKPRPSLEDALADPSVIANLGDEAPEVVREWLADEFRSLIDDAQDRSPDDVRQDFQDVAADIARRTGLGDVVVAEIENAVRETGKDLLRDHDVDFDYFKDNPAAMQAMASLAGTEDDDYYREHMVKKLTDDLESRLSDEDESSAEDLDGVLTRFRDRVADLAEASGVTDLEGFTTAAFEGNQARIEELGAGIAAREADNGGGALGVFKDVVDGAGDLLSGALDALGNVAGSLIENAGDVVGEAFDQIGNVADFAGDVGGDLAEGLADGVAAVADAAGADGVADDARAIGDQVDEAADAAGDTINYASDRIGETIENVADIAGAAARDGVEGVADRLLEPVLGPEKPEYKDQVGGVVGAITNRLGTGDSVFVDLDVGVNGSIWGLLGVTLSGGAELGRDADGNLTLKFEAEGSGQAGVTGGTEVEAGAVGIEANAKAGLQAGVKGVLELKFDPENPDDVGRLRDLLEPDPARVFSSGFNPLAALPLSPTAFASAIGHNWSSTTGGVEAGVFARGGVGVEGEEINLGVEGSAEAVAGVSTTHHANGSTDWTVSLEAGAELEASASVGSLGVAGEAALRAVRSVTVTRDAQGNITGLAGINDVQGHAGAGGAAASGTEDDEDETTLGFQSGTTVSQKHSLTGPALDEAKDRIAAGESVLSVFVDLAGDPANVTTEETTREVDQLELGFEFGARVVGVGAKVQAELTVGKAHTETEVVSEEG